MKYAVLILSKGMLVNVLLDVPVVYSQERSAYETDIRDELEERMNLFENAIQYLYQENYDALRQIDEDIENAITFLDTWQSTRQSIARGIRTRTASNEEIYQLSDDFLESVGEAKTSRIELSLSWPLFIKEPREKERFAEELEKFITSHRSMIQAANLMYRKRNAVPLPSMVGLYGPDKIDLAAGYKCEVEFILENIDHDNWSEIKLQFETIDGDTMKEIWAEPDHIRVVSSGSAIRFNICIDTEYKADELTRLLITSNEIRSQETLRIIDDN